MKNNLKNIALLGLFAITSLSALRAQTTITHLQDDFSDNNRSNQSLTTSSAWFNGGASSNLSASTGALVRSSSAGSMVTYFAASGSPVQLGVGDVLKVNFKMTLSGTAPSGSTLNNTFRFGVYNSHGTSADGNALTTANRITADNQFNSSTTPSHSNPIFANNAGYYLIANFAPTSAGNGMRMLRKESNGTSTSVYQEPGMMGLGSGGLDLNFMMGTLYDVNMEVTRTATGVTITQSFSGSFVDSASTTITGVQSMTATDNTSSAVYTFDALALGIGGAFTTTFDDLTVVTIVPEPESIYLVFGLGALLLYGFKRSRKAV